MPRLPSRNRGFELYERPGLRRALNAQRLLASIARDLERPGPRATIRVRAISTRGPSRFRLEYDDETLACARVSFLTRGELDRLRTMVGSTNGRFRLDERPEGASGP